VEAANAGANAIAFADMLHYRRTTFAQLREVAEKSGIKVRTSQ
jgi:imidazole glycerol phosphate synthase subunit HisF